MNSKQMKEQILLMSGVDVMKCMTCGKCSATCPAYSEMEYHPHQFVSMIKNGEIEPLMESDSIFYCLTCFACAERCPRGVEPARLIEAVRLLSVRRQGKDRMTPGDIAEKLDSDIPQQALVTAFRKYTK